MKINREEIYTTGYIPNGYRLIQDTMPFQVLDLKKGVIKESNGGSRPILKVTGIYQKADEKNQNGRIYPLEVLKEAIGGIQKAVTERRVLGELDHPSDAKIHMDRVCHLITRIWLENNSVYGESEVLNDDRMPCGAMLSCLLERKIPVGVSSRGVGDMEIVSEGGDESYKVQPGYQIVTFDAVADPSVADAQMRIMESRQRIIRPNKHNHKLFVERLLVREMIRNIRGNQK